MILGSLLLVFIFTIIVCIKYGIPETLSDSYYLTGEKPWFSIITILGGLLMIPKAVTLASEWGLIFVLSGILGFLMTGMFPKFISGYQRTLHLIGARWSGIVGQLSVIFLGLPWIMLTWILPLLLFIGVLRDKPENLMEALDKHKFIFWVEMTCFVNLYLGLMI